MLVTVPCRVNPLVRSTALLFDPAGAVNGRIIMAARYPGVPRCRENPDGMQRVPELPETQTAWVKSCDGETKEVLVSGATVVPMRCNGYAMRARDEKPGIVYVCPKEGYTGWMGNMAVAKGALNMETAKAMGEFWDGTGTRRDDQQSRALFQRHQGGGGGHRTGACHSPRNQPACARNNPGLFASRHRADEQGLNHADELKGVFLWRS